MKRGAQRRRPSSSIEKQGDAWRVADDIHTLGVIAAESRDWETARALFEESVLLLREAGDDDYALVVLGPSRVDLPRDGDLERARGIYEADPLAGTRGGQRECRGNDARRVGDDPRRGRPRDRRPSRSLSRRIGCTERPATRSKRRSTCGGSPRRSLPSDPPRRPWSSPLSQHRSARNRDASVPWVDRKMENTLSARLRARLGLRARSIVRGSVASGSPRDAAVAMAVAPSVEPLG